jgi:hypothetical protein
VISSVFSVMGGDVGVVAGHLYSAERPRAPDRVVRVQVVRRSHGRTPYASCVECHRNGHPYGGVRGQPFAVVLTYRDGAWRMPAQYRRWGQS